MLWLHGVADRLHIYNYLRYSRLYRNILRWRNPVYLASLNSDVAFYEQVLCSRLGRAPSLVFDVGANFGDKAWAFRQLGAKVICFEPDVRCADALRVRFRHDPNVVVEQVALGGASGDADFHVLSSGSAYNTLNDKHREIFHCQNGVGHLSPSTVRVRVATLDLMISKYGVPDFIKVDVEGYEATVFKGLNRPISAMTFEANLPEFWEETQEVIKKIRSSNGNARFNLLPAGSKALLWPADVDESTLQMFLNGDEQRSFDILAVTHV